MKWTIAFFGDEDGVRRWWWRFTKPGFRHCFALRYMVDLNSWALVDWSNRGLNVEFLPKQYVDAIMLAVNDSGGAFLDVDTEEQPARLFPPLTLYCVTAVKELVGLRDWRVITPWQLYCALRKRGAQRMFDLSYLEETSNGKSARQT